MFTNVVLHVVKMSWNMSWKCRVRVWYNGYSGNYAKAYFGALPYGGAFSVPRMQERGVFP